MNLTNPGFLPLPLIGRPVLQGTAGPSRTAEHQGVTAMLLSSLVLASALAAQEPPPPAAPPPQDPAAVSSAVTSTDTKPASNPTIEAGLAAFKKRRFAKAESEFKKAVEADPSSAA